MPAKKTVKPESEGPIIHSHPICHLINGERLSYLLIKIRTNLFKAGDQIKKVLESREIGVDASSCAYYVFGGSDVIIRIWSTEADLDKLTSSIRDEVKDAVSTYNSKSTIVDPRNK
jgi:hypothetical protein